MSSGVWKLNTLFTRSIAGLFGNIYHYEQAFEVDPASLQTATFENRIDSALQAYLVPVDFPASPGLFVGIQEADSIWGPKCGFPQLLVDWAKHD